MKALLKSTILSAFLIILMGSAQIIRAQEQQDGQNSSKQTKQTKQPLTPEEQKESEEALAVGKAWQDAIERAGGEAKYNKLQPEFNRLKTAFFNQPDATTKKALLDYIVTNKLFWPKPVNLTQERIKEAQKSGKTMRINQMPVTDKAGIETELDQWIQKK